MQNTNAYKIQSYAVFSGFTNSIIISLCFIKSSNQMCDGRLDGRTDRHMHPSISTPLKATRIFYFFLFSPLLIVARGPGGSLTQVIGSNNSYKHITTTSWVRVRLCKLQKGCTRLAAACDKVYQLLAHGRCMVLSGYSGFLHH